MCALQDLRKSKKVPRKTAVQKTTRVEIEDDILYVKLSPQLHKQLGEAAKVRGKSETDLIYEAITDAISKEGKRRTGEQA
jgi:predicted HicB family RNase H-like nuclease